MYAKFKSALVTDAALVIDNTLPHLENTFAPVPPPEDNAWLDMVLDFVSMGVPMVGGKFIDDCTNSYVFYMIPLLNLLI